LNHIAHKMAESAVTGRIILPIWKHNFAIEPSICPSSATQIPGAAVAWEAYLCQKFRIKRQAAPSCHNIPPSYSPHLCAAAVLES
jgi:hypothetical protein